MNSELHEMNVELKKKIDNYKYENEKLSRQVEVYKEVIKKNQPAIYCSICDSYFLYSQYPSHSKCKKHTLNLSKCQESKTKEIFSNL